MKTKLFFTFLVCILLGISSAFSQGFEAPSEGKAAIYFARVTIYGKPMAFETFHQDKLIGYTKGDQYIRYECEPGSHLFWSSSENKEFITAEVEAGKTYIIVVDVIMGAMKGRVGLKPLDLNDSEIVDRVVKLINKKEPMVTEEKKMIKQQKKLEDFIVKNLDKYENEWKAEKNFKHVSADMFFPEDKMQ